MIGESVCAAPDRIHHAQTSRGEQSIDHILENALWLLRRQNELEMALERSRGSKIFEERELLELRSRLAQYPEAVDAIASAAANLRRPIDTLSAQDVTRAC